MPMYSSLRQGFLRPLQLTIGQNNSKHGKLISPKLQNKNIGGISLHTLTVPTNLNNLFGASVQTWH